MDFVFEIQAKLHQKRQLSIQKKPPVYAHRRLEFIKFT